MTIQTEPYKDAKATLADLTGVLPGRKKLDGLGGEDSRIFGVSPVFDGSFVAKHSNKIMLSPVEEQLAIETAHSLQSPLILARIFDRVRNQDVASVIFNRKVIPIDGILKRNLFPTATNSIDPVFSRYSFDDRIEALEYIINKKIIATHACVQTGILPDFDSCNVGYCQNSKTIQLFDFGGIRTNVSPRILTAHTQNTLFEEIRDLANANVDITKLHIHDAEMAYRIIRFRDCMKVAAAVADHIPPTISSPIPANKWYECPYAQGVWNKYRYLEQISLRGKFPPPCNHFYDQDRKQLQRFAHNYSGEVILAATTSLNRHLNAQLRIPSDRGCSEYELVFLKND